LVSERRSQLIFFLLLVGLQEKKREKRKKEREKTMVRVFEAEIQIQIWIIQTKFENWARIVSRGV
jgi:hypothetical protein